MDSFIQDIRFALRLLYKNPVISGILIFTLALGIGANTAIFSVVNAVLLRPLPFPNPNRLVTIRLDLESHDIHDASGPYSDIAEWRQQSRSFEAMAAYSWGSVNLITGGEPERVVRMKVNANFFPMLATKMALGRDFLSEEDQPGANRVVIMSHRLWKRQFGAAKDAIGRSVNLDGNLYTVVGILPPGFKLEENEVDLYTPVALSSARSRNEEWTCMAYARLKPGISIAQAQKELDTIYQRMERENRREITGFRAHIWGLREFMVREVRLSLLILFAAVALVLLIACANVAILLLARAGARQQEIAIRTALGAARWRLLRQLLTESTLLALIGGVLGLLLAHWSLGILGAIRIDRLPLLNQARLDLSVFSFTLLISLLTGLLFGLVPALAVSRTNLHETLKEGGRGSTEGRGKNRLRSLLVVAEVALALLLMIGASLMIRSLLNLRRVNPGFNAANVLTASISLPSLKYSKPEQQIAFYQQLEEKLRGIPGITTVGLVSLLPLSGNNQGTSLLIEGRPPAGPSDLPILWYRVVNTQYFRALQIPLVKGRLFTEQDAAGKAPVLIINETMARRYWPNQDPIGKRAGDGRPDGWMRVVGVVGDIHHMNLASAPDAEIFFPFPQNPQAGMNLTLRTSSDPLNFAPLLRRAIMELDREQPVARVASLEQAWSDSMTTNRFSAMLLGIFAALALLLAILGIYGVISFSVTHRQHEIGIRMALGARGSDVLRMVVFQGTLLAAFGIGLGLMAAYALTRVLSSLLYGVKATDPLVFLGVSLLFASIAALASFLLARRAASVDPMVALRHE